MTRSDICISLGDMQFSELIQRIPSFSLAEIRLDLLDLTKEQIKQVFSSHSNLVVTCREGKFSRKETLNLLRLAIISGAAYVDLDIKTANEDIGFLLDLTRSKNKTLILSYHNFEKTPAQEELELIAGDCFSKGSGIVKIACMIHSQDDIARLLALYWKFKNIISIGMGSRSLITRIAATSLGAPFTYAGLEGFHTAPGQPDYRHVEEFLNYFETAGE